MANLTKTLLLTILLCISIPQQCFAIADTVSNVGKSVGIGVTAKEIDQDATVALDMLLKNSSAATELAKTAKAILIFPRILKAGFVIGGLHGNGALRKDGKTVGYYNIIAGSYGLQIGAQAFGYALFFMDDEGFDYLLKNNAGWEVGAGPSVVIVDEGMAKTLNNTTITKSVYVFTFSQQGLMAGLGIQGSKISKTTPAQE